MGTKAELDAIAALANQTEHHDHNIKITAARALARYINHPEAVSALNKLANHYDPIIKIVAIKTLAGVDR